MFEGVRQSHCEKQIFRHNDMAHLEQLLKAADRMRPKLILFESLYSMDGGRGAGETRSAISRNVTAR